MDFHFLATCAGVPKVNACMHCTFSVSTSKIPTCWTYSTKDLTCSSMTCMEDLSEWLIASSSCTVLFDVQIVQSHCMAWFQMMHLFGEVKQCSTSSSVFTSHCHIIRSWWPSPISFWVYFKVSYVWLITKWLQMFKWTLTNTLFITNDRCPRKVERDRTFPSWCSLWKFSMKYCKMMKAFVSIHPCWSFEPET